MAWWRRHAISAVGSFAFHIKATNRLNFAETWKIKSVLDYNIYDCSSQLTFQIFQIYEWFKITIWWSELVKFYEQKAAGSYLNDVHGWFGKSRYSFYSEWCLDLWLWNGALCDMFSKSCALPRHSFEEQTVCVSVVEAAGARLTEFFTEWSSPTAQSVQPGLLEFTQTVRVVTPTAATSRHSEQEVPRWLMWPRHDWASSSHLFSPHWSIFALNTSRGSFWFFNTWTGCKTTRGLPRDHLHQTCRVTAMPTCHDDSCCRAVFIFSRRRWFRDSRENWLPAWWLCGASGSYQDGFCD